jgi:hypothetical protein
LRISVMPDQPQIIGYPPILTLNAESVIAALTVSKNAFSRF